MLRDSRKGRAASRIGSWERPRCVLLVLRGTCRMPGSSQLSPAGEASQRLHINLIPSHK